MKQRFYWFSLLTALLVAFILPGTALAKAQPTVPLKGRSSGVVTVTSFDAVAGIVYTHVAGEGEASISVILWSVLMWVWRSPPAYPHGNWTLTAARAGP